MCELFERVCGIIKQGLQPCRVRKLLRYQLVPAKIADEAGADFTLLDCRPCPQGHDAPGHRRQQNPCSSQILRHGLQPSLDRLLNILNRMYQQLVDRMNRHIGQRIAKSPVLLLQIVQFDTDRRLHQLKIDITIPVEPPFVNLVERRVHFLVQRHQGPDVIVIVGSQQSGIFTKTDAGSLLGMETKPGPVILFLQRFKSPVRICARHRQRCSSTISKSCESSTDADSMIDTEQYFSAVILTARSTFFASRPRPFTT